VILEIAMLSVRAGEGEAFQAAFAEAQGIIAAVPGYVGHELHRCVELADRYVLLVRWRSVEDHEVGFRQSPRYLEWKRLLHHFYDPFPVVEHVELVEPQQAGDALRPTGSAGG
jgi:heme-degrading monooxygenase HmoA